MQIHCTTCGDLVPAADLNLDSQLARCRKCDSVFSFADAIQSDTAAVPLANEMVSRPAAVRVEDIGDGARFYFTWRSAKLLFLIPFCIIWNGFLLFWYSGVFFGSKMMGPGVLFFALFPMLHVAVGVGLAYYCFAALVNQTIITVSSGILRIRHSPFPWPGNRALAAADISQLYCTRRFARNENSTSVSYKLCAILKSGQRLTILSSLDDVETAKYFEHEIERILRIKPRPSPANIAVDPRLG